MLWIRINFLIYRISNYTKIVLRYSPLPHPDVKSKRVYKIPPGWWPVRHFRCVCDIFHDFVLDTESVEATFRGILPACLDIHEWHWYEFSFKGFSRVSTGWHLFAFKSQITAKLPCICWRYAGLFKVCMCTRPTRMINSKIVPRFSWAWRNPVCFFFQTKGQNLRTTKLFVKF